MHQRGQHIAADDELEAEKTGNAEITQHLPRLPHMHLPGLVLEGRPMSNVFSNFLVPIALVAVAIVLLFGLINMMRGGSPNRSQKLMRLRVLLQFVAIIVVMVTIWILGR